MMLLEITWLDPTNPFTWINVGVLGVFAWAGIRGYVWLRPAVDQIRQDNTDLKVDLHRLQTMLLETVVPAITESNSLSRESTEAVREAQELMRLLADELKRSIRERERREKS
jgi:hypothetical protein